MKPELIADCQCRIGESPIWHPLEKRLYWVFIPRGLVLRFDPVNGKHYITKQTKEPLFYNLIFVFSES